MVHNTLAMVEDLDNRIINFYTNRVICKKTYNFMALLQRSVCRKWAF
jgi:hypothetical protein